MNPTPPPAAAWRSAPPASLRPLAQAGQLVLHFYDLTCPFCYVSQPKTWLLTAAGLLVVELPFQAHPDVPTAGVTVPARTGPMYEVLAAAAQQAGLPLRWQAHLPNSQLALAAAEWTRQQQPDQFAAYQAALFAAHFAHGLDLGDPAVLLALAAQSQVDGPRLQAALEAGTAQAALPPAQELGRQLGVTGTPAWLSAGFGILGNQPATAFEQFAAQLQALSAPSQS